MIEFWNLMKRSIEPSLFDSINRLEAERRLIESETSLAAAKGCVEAMMRVWPEGVDIYDRFLLSIAELLKRRQYIEEFISLFELNLAQSVLNQRHQEIMAKNRETMMIAGTYMAESTDILYELTGIELKI
jgi:hypothetical protein